MYIVFFEKWVPHLYTVMQTIYPQSGSQLFNSLLFRFKSKNEFIKKIYKVKQLKKNTFALWKVKMFCITVFSLNVRSAKGCEIFERLWVFIKKTNYVTIFEKKNFVLQRVKSYDWEVQLRHGVWGSRFTRPPTVCTKTGYSLLKESTHNFFLTT